MQHTHSYNILAPGVSNSILNLMLMKLLRKFISIFYTNFMPLTLIKLLGEVFFFSSCFIESVFNFVFVSYGLKLVNKRRLQGILKVCSNIVDIPLHGLSHLHKVSSLNKVRSILTDPNHPLNSEFLLLPSGQSFLRPECRTNRLKHLFVPAARGFLNYLITCLFHVFNS